MKVESFLNWYGPKPEEITQARWDAMTKQAKGAYEAKSITY